MNDTYWEAHSFMYRNPEYHSSVSEIIVNGTDIGHCEAQEFPYHMPYATYYCKNYLELGRWLFPLHTFKQNSCITLALQATQHKSLIAVMAKTVT
jgi:hypothetical protein